MHVCGGQDESAVPFCPSHGKMSNRPLMDSAVKCALPTKREEETEFPTAAPFALSLSHGWVCQESFFAAQGKYVWITAFFSLFQLTNFLS